MKISKKVLMICLILTMLVAAGCTQSGSRDQRSSEDYRTGSEGLRIYLEQNLPPSRIYDDQDLDVVVRLENRGADSIGYAGDRLYLSGFDQSIITDISTIGEQIPELEGKSMFNYEGDFDTIKFKGNVRALEPRGIDKYDPTLLITACYGYKTVASESVCIDPDPYSIAYEEEVCVPTNVGFGTQGAPIAVSNVEVESSSKKTRFKIEIQNVGGGTPLRLGADYLYKCNPYSGGQLQYDDVDYVALESVEVANVELYCKPLDQGHVRLINGRGVVFCEYEHRQKGPAFSSPLTITLGYGYRQTLPFRLQILSAR